MLPLILGVFLGSCAAVFSQDGNSGIYSFFASNCGFNCAAVVLEGFNIGYDAKSLQNDLQVDTDLLHPCSFLELKLCFQSHGLIGIGEKDVNIKDLLSQLKPGVLAILQLKSKPFQHFVVIRRSGQGLYRVDDYPSLNVNLNYSEFESQLMPQMSGNVLLVMKKGDQYLEEVRQSIHRNVGNEDVVAADIRQPKLQAKPLPSIHGKSIALNSVVTLSKDPNDEDRLIGQLKIENTGSSDISIKEVKGACSCFLGWSGPNIIAPKQSAALQLHVSARRIPSSFEVGFTKVVVETDDILIPVAVVSLINAPNENIVRVVPEVIEINPDNSKKFPSSSSYISLLIKSNISLTSKDIHLKYNHDALSVSEVEPLRGDVFSGYNEVARFKVSANIRGKDISIITISTPFDKAVEVKVRLPR